MTREAAADAELVPDLHDSPKTIAVFLFDGMEELDAVGPWEVFAWWTRHFPNDGYVATTFSADGATVECEKSLRILPHCSANEVAAVEVLLHPGGDGANRLMADLAHLEWLRLQRESVPLMTSVCTGALTFAAAGLLLGRHATTHHSALDELARVDPTVTVEPLERFVGAGDVITSAGISAGIDMALHIVGRLAGPQRKLDVIQGIEYRPGQR